MACVLGNQGTNARVAGTVWKQLGPIVGRFRSAVGEGEMNDHLKALRLKELGGRPSDKPVTDSNRLQSGSNRGMHARLT